MFEHVVEPCCSLAMVALDWQRTVPQSVTVHTQDTGRVSTLQLTVVHTCLIMAARLLVQSAPAWLLVFYHNIFADIA